MNIYGCLLLKQKIKNKKLSPLFMFLVDKRKSANSYSSSRSDQCIVLMQLHLSLLLALFL